MAPQRAAVAAELNADGDGLWYVAWDPELPGCMSHGTTLAEALANLADARALYLAGAGDAAPEAAGIHPGDPARHG